MFSSSTLTLDGSEHPQHSAGGLAPEQGIYHSVWDGVPVLHHFPIIVILAISYNFHCCACNQIFSLVHVRVLLAKQP